MGRNEKNVLSLWQILKKKIRMSKKWFVARTRAKQEKAIKARLDELSVECFLPVRTEIHQWRDRRKKVEAVLIPNTIFIRAEKDDALLLANEKGVLLSYKQDYLTRKMMEIPDKQMNAFIFLWNVDSSAVTPSPDLLYVKGERVRVVRGPFLGYEGELVQNGTTKSVIIRLDQLFVGTVEISLADVESCGDDEDYEVNE